MKRHTNLKAEHPEFDRILYWFFSGIASMSAVNVFSLMSPNLRELALVDRHKEKFEKVFLFGREIKGCLINRLTEISSIHYDAIVIVCLTRSDQENPSLEIRTEQDKIENLRFRIYRTKFINIDGNWHIDDIYLDNNYKA